jgi:hypothetical protein
MLPNHAEKVDGVLYFENFLAGNFLVLNVSELWLGKDRVIMLSNLIDRVIVGTHVHLIVGVGAGPLVVVEVITEHF